MALHTAEASWSRVGLMYRPTLSVCPVTLYKRGKPHVRLLCYGFTCIIQPPPPPPPPPIMLLKLFTSSSRIHPNETDRETFRDVATSATHDTHINTVRTAGIKGL
jgi:hypothetical protein